MKKLIEFKILGKKKTEEFFPLNRLKWSNVGHKMK